MGAVVGIDLGTTNTVVAAIRDGRPVALPDESGSTLIPSIVSFLPSGAVLVGNAASERRSQDARNTIYSIKRLIGRTWDSNEVKQATARFPFELREGPGRATFVIARGETYTLPEISAFVLRKAKSIAELELGEPVDRAVITVPANFNDLQRAATKVAGRVAGLEVLRILNEPTAAALAFGHSRGNRERIAIYDFGGGTFDVTLLLLTDDVFEVLATAGDTFLGGDDIDSAIVDRMARQFGPDPSSDPRTQPDTLERFRTAAEYLKLELSEAPEARLRLEAHEIARPSALDFAMTRDELDELVDPIVARTFKVCHDALSMAKLAPKDIDHVLLVGGTTRIPLVKVRVEEYFGKRARADLNPHEVVALGAAQQAMTLTQLRATASGIPVAPPPRPRLASSSSEHGDGNADGDADAKSRQKTEPFGDFRKQTNPGVGSGGLVQPGRVSVVPPEGPLSHPAPTTQNFGSRERRTTGVGLGPRTVPLPQVGVETVSPAREPLDPIVPPSTFSGLGPKQSDVVHPNAQSGAADARPSQVQGKSPRETIPDEVGRWDEPPIDAVADHGLPIVNAQARVAPERMLLATVSTDTNQAARLGLPDPSLSDADDDAGTDEPTVIRRSTQSPSDWSEADPRQAALTGDELADRLARDEASTASHVFDEPDDLPAVASSPPSAASPSTPRPSGRPSSLNEAEIRARYGNLPLIVGGKRVRTRAAGSDADAPSGSGSQRPPASTAESDLPANAANNLPAIPTPQLPPRVAASRALSSPSPPSPDPITLRPASEAKSPTLEELPQVLGTITTRPKPPPAVPFPPLAARPLAAPPIPSFEADAAETDYVEADASEPQWRPDRIAPSSIEPSPPDESIPKSQRQHSIRPSARQNATDELELPIPDLPPQRPPPVPARLGIGGTGPIAALRPPPRTEPSAVRHEGPAPIGPDRPARIPPVPQSPSSPMGPGTNFGQSFPLGATLPLGAAASTTGAWQPPPTPPTAAESYTSLPTQPQAVEVPSLLASLPKSPSLRPALLIDVTPLSLCVETVGGYVDVLITRNTPVPCERTRDFVTAHDNQQSVIVRVAQGESKLFLENVLLGEVQLTGIPAAPRGQSRIAVTFGIDSDGILHVRALDVLSGQSALADLRLSGAPSSPEVAQMMLRHAAKGHA